MRKILLLSAALLMVIGANAQIRWGVKAGGNLSKFVTYKVGDNNVGDQKAKFGFHVGGVMEYSINEMFAIQPELQFIMNGGKMETSLSTGVGEIKVKTKVDMYQLQLPVNAKIKFGTDDLKMFVLVGPYIGLGLSAKSKVDGSDSSCDLYKKHDDESESMMSRFDFGINTGIGVEVSKFTFGIGYQYGLLNLANRDNLKIKQGTALLSVGYFF